MLPPTTIVVEDSENNGLGGLSVMVFTAEELASLPLLSATVTFTVYDPAVAYEWLSLAVAPARMSTWLSPQSTVVVMTVPSESEDVIVRPMSLRVIAVVAVSVKPTVGGLSSMAFVATLVLVLPLLSITVNVTM